VVFAGLTIYLGTQAWRRGGDQLWTKRAEQVQMGPNYSTEQAALLEKALACEPKNYLTAYNIGECFWTQSLDGGDDYANLAQKALDFYQLGTRLNPYDERCSLRSGMCLDWMGRHADAEKYYAAAEKLDPNGDFVVANIGWHYLQIDDYAAARQWFIRAVKLSNWQDETAKANLFEICQPKLMQKAAGQLPMRLFYHAKDN
jgi:tetratricopeptide (TPR) repeat protein